VTSTALGNCARFAAKEKCECYIVHRDGKLVVSFPPNWPKTCQ
jgi:hypothetical protein